MLSFSKSSQRILQSPPFLPWPHQYLLLICTKNRKLGKFRQLMLNTTYLEETIVRGSVLILIGRSCLTAAFSVDQAGPLKKSKFTLSIVWS
jgi:hypothetical protein